MASTPTLTLLHGRNSYSVPIPETFFELQRSIERFTNVSIESQRLFFSGRKLTPSPDTSPATLGMFKGAKIMLLGRAASASRSSLQERQAQPTPLELPRETGCSCANLEKVHACRKQVTDMETRLEGMEGKLTSGEPLVEDRSRLRQETLVLSEGFMKVLLTLDSIAEETERGEASGWKTERKALVRRVQANLERCDALDKDVQ